MGVLCILPVLAVFRPRFSSVPFGPFVGWLVGFTPRLRGFPCGEILGSRERSKSQPLATIPRYRCDYPPWGRAKSQLRAVPMRLGPVESGGACYREVRRIPLLSTWVNKGMKKGRARPHSNATVAEELHGR